MNERVNLLTRAFAATVLAATSFTAAASGPVGDGNVCMDVEIQPFHMMPDGSCAVRDYLDGALQEAFYPFTIEDHLFNCEYFGPATPLPTGDLVPSSVISQGEITGTIGGHEFTATLLCASLTNWYQDSCADPNDPSTCSFQLAQPFLSKGLPFPRITEVSVLDGVISGKGKGKMAEIPVVMATRAAGITHIEDLEAPLVGASITHSLLGMVTYKDDDGEDHGIRVLDASADLLLQGHIFFPGTVEEDVDPDTGANEAAVIKGVVCSEELYNLLNEKGKKKAKKNGKGEDDD
jgi:hypothetical protein